MTLIKVGLMSEALLDDIDFGKKFRAYLDSVLLSRARHEWHRDEELMIFGTQQCAPRHEMRAYGFAPFRAGVRKYCKRVWA